MKGKGLINYLDCSEQEREGERGRFRIWFLLSNSAEFFWGKRGSWKEQKRAAIGYKQINHINVSKKWFIGTWIIHNSEGAKQAWKAVQSSRPPSSSIPFSSLSLAGPETGKHYRNTAPCCSLHFRRGQRVHTPRGRALSSPNTVLIVMDLISSGFATQYVNIFNSEMFIYLTQKPQLQ